MHTQFYQKIELLMEQTFRAAAEVPEMHKRLVRAFTEAQDRSLASARALIAASSEMQYPGAMELRVHDDSSGVDFPIVNNRPESFGLN